MSKAYGVCSIVSRAHLMSSEYSPGWKWVCGESVDLQQELQVIHTLVAC